MLSILQLGQNPDQIHAIGHSLGARVGKKLENLVPESTEFLTIPKVFDRKNPKPVKV